MTRQSVLPCRPPGGLGDLTALVDPAVVSAALADSVERPPVRPLRLEKAWPLPRIPLMLLYREEGTGGPAGQPAWWAIHALPRGRAPGAYRRAARKAGATVLRELDVLAQRFPRDLMLPSLPAVLERPAELLRAVPGLTATVARSQVQAQVVGYKPARRCSLRLVSEAASSDAGELFGKLLAAPVALQQWQVHAAVDRAMALVGRHDVEVAGPEHLVDDAGLLIWRRRSGVSVHDLLAGPGAGAAVGAAARGLAALHASAPAWPDSHPPERELATLGLWVGAAARAFSDRRDELLAAELRVRLAAAAAAGGPLLPAHRDFYDKQVLLNGDTVVLLDFETACRAEPELDLANFLAHLELRRLQGVGEAQPDLGAGFLAEYEEEAGPADRHRLQWYCASALLRLACVYAFRPTWGALSEALLTAAREAISTNTTRRLEGVNR